MQILRSKERMAKLRCAYFGSDALTDSQKGQAAWCGLDGDGAPEAGGGTLAGVEPYGGEEESVDFVAHFAR